MKPYQLLFILLTLSSCTAQSQLSKPNLKRIDNLFNHVNETTPGYMIGVIQSDSFIFQKGYGLANLEHQIPVSSKSAFNIASLSKQFTAASIALLILDEKISLDDNIKKYIPNFPDYKHDIQIKHLIYMTSGINDYYYNDRNTGLDWSSLHFFNVDTAIQAALLGNDTLMYQPGTQWSYSNLNYMLLTKIVEKASEIRFSEFAQKRIFEPLGMNNTFVNDDIFQVIPNRANGYNYRDKENTDWLLASNYIQTKGTGFLQINRNSPHYGGSGIYTTMEDFQKWITNFNTKKLGGEAFYNLMHQTMKFDHSKTNDAFGLAFGEFNGHQMIWYEGGDWGFSSYMIRFPRKDITVACFSNLGTGNARKYTHQVIDALSDEGIIKLEE